MKNTLDNINTAIFNCIHAQLHEKNSCSMHLKTHCGGENFCSNKHVKVYSLFAGPVKNK